MNYSHQINIDLPREQVIALFDNAENMKKWQPGLLSYDFLDGEPGEEGSTMNMIFERRKGKSMELKETILKNNLPEEIQTSYETKGVFNIQKNSFKELNGSTTLWTSESEFRFEGIGMKLIGLLMPGAFKKQSYKYMVLFKEFAEEESKK